VAATLASRPFSPGLGRALHVEAYLYNYEYSSKVGESGLPIFPSIGLRVDD